MQRTGRLLSRISKYPCLALDSLARPAHPGNVAYAWYDGKLLYRKGEFLTLDIGRICWETERRAFGMAGKPMNFLRSYAV